jgi:hypothetical protein
MFKLHAWRVVRFACLLLAAGLVSAFDRDANAEERRFAVMLAVPPKSPPADYPKPDSLPGTVDVYRQYFGQASDGDLSFAEYWNEISYGNVNVTGNTLGWVEIPWPILPSTSSDGSSIPHTQLGSGTALQQFRGEDFDDSSLPDGVWTPGERFMDLNGNGEYDDEGEETRDGYGSVLDEGDPGADPPVDPKCDENQPNGRIEVVESTLKAGAVESEEWDDTDNDGYWDVPEPFEDFTWVRARDETTRKFIWKKLDPSYKNTDEKDRAWAERYIRTNYPGDAGSPLKSADDTTASGYMARYGNGKYDPPDSWTEKDNTKIMLDDEPRKTEDEIAYTTPRPDVFSGPGDPANLYPWNYGTNAADPSRPVWWNEYWKDMHKLAGVPEASIPPAPPAPVWSPATPLLEPFNPSTMARPFEPNLGGTTWRSGTIAFIPPDPAALATCFGQPAPDAAAAGDGTVDGANHIHTGRTILYDARGEYDGPAEFSDLSSSIYHSHKRTYMVKGTRVVVGPFSGIGCGDGRLGEVTSPYSSSDWGQDIGTNDPARRGGPDDNIPAAGPLAYNVNGTNGHDGGNILALELLTRITDNRDDGAYATYDADGKPAPGILKRDYNLDGLIDQGEVRDAGTENYVYDAYSSGPNDGQPPQEGESAGQSEAYPFNRQRLTEDVVAALDGSVHWDQFVTQYGATKYVFGGTLLPADVCPDGIARGGRGVFQGSAPSMQWTIYTNDIPFSEAPLQFTDEVIAIDNTGESGMKCQLSHCAKEIMSHAFLHTWEGYPDMFDYDVYLGGLVNYPVGIWDVMGADLPACPNSEGDCQNWVHPSPVLKSCTTGRAGSALKLFGDHSPWLEVTDLTTVLQPFEKTKVTLTDYAFDSANSAYCYSKLDDPGERFYFWRLTRATPTVAWEVNFSKSLPGDGVMIMHTDLGDNPESLPTQRLSTHFTYSILQADGLGQLDAGLNAGDAGDPWPRSTSATTWNDSTYPNSRWWGQTPSGLSITDIQQSDTYSVVEFLWTPRLVPSLRFINPPGGAVTNKNYGLTYEAFDFHGGTQIEFFVQNSDSGYTGRSLGVVSKQGMPDPVTATFPVPLSLLPSDGQCYFYARLTPGTGADNGVEPAYSAPQPNSNNRGHGRLATLPSFSTVDVDLNQSKLESWTLTCADDSTPDAELWEVKGSLSGVLSTRAKTGVLYQSVDAGISFKIEWAGTKGNALVSNTDGVYTLEDSSAHFVASDFKSFDTVRILPGSGPIPGVYNVKSVLGPTKLELASDAGSGAAGYRVHSFQTNNAFGPPDVFTFMTTGKTAYSRPIKIVHGQLVSQLNAVITTAFPDDATNPSRRAPLRVRFDASQSTDETGHANTALTYKWDFGDGSPQTSTEMVQEVVFNAPHEAPDLITVSLAVTNPVTGTEGNAEVTLSVPPMEDTLAILPELDRVSVPEGGTAALRVRLNQQPPTDVIVSAAALANTVKPHHISVTTSQVTIPRDQWDQWQTITLAAAEDDDAANRAAIIRLSAPGLFNRDVTAVEQDNDQMTIVTSLAPADTIGVPEQQTSTFQVRLSNEPEDSIVVQVGAVQGTPASHIALQSASTLIFTPTNWNTDQDVTLSASKDQDASNREAVIRFISSSLPTKDVRATEVDNDTQSIVADKSSVPVSEGGTATFQLKLAAEPDGDFAVNLTITGDPSLSIQTGATLTFTPANWTAYQTVTVAADEDADAVNGTATIRCRGAGISDTTISLVVQENDTLVFVTNTSNVVVPEGGTAQFNIKLAAQPQGAVLVTVAPAGTESDGRSDLKVSAGATLSFTPANWDVYQPVTLSAAQDADAANLSATIRCRAMASSDTVPDKLLTATEQDDDTLDIQVSPVTVEVQEGGTSKVNVCLTADPMTSVVVTTTWQSGDAGLSVTFGGTLVFTSSNWRALQTVTLSDAADPDRIDGTAIFRVSAAGLPTHTVTAVEVDTTPVKFVVANTTPTVPEGATVTFDVALDAEPDADSTVTLQRISGVETISVQSGATLTFTKANWNVPQQVTLAAADDDNAYGDVAVFRFSALGATDLDLTVTELDKDAQSIVTDVTAVNVPEGSAAQFKVKLSHEPHGTMAISVAAGNGDSSLLVASASPLKFTAANWNVYQTVTLQATPDLDAVNGTRLIRCTNAWLTTVAVTAIEVDSNEQFIVCQPETLTVPEAGSATFGVTLNAAPIDSVTMTITRVSGSDRLSVASGTSLAFTPDDWFTAHNVTITAVEDSDFASEQAVFRLSAAGMPDKEITVVAQDIDTDKQPTASNQSVTVDENGSVAVVLTGNDPDQLPSPLTFKIVSNPVHGRLSGFDATTGSVVYRPDADYAGGDQFTFRTNDGQLDSNDAIVTITVKPASTPITDADGDGVADGSDQCPGTVAGASVDANGCAAAQRDDDNDGVPNGSDQCAATTAGADVDANGCAAAQRDDDGDGVPNGSDQCPGTAAGATVDANGCVTAQQDDDSDGVPNSTDQCANTASGATVDSTGCSEDQTSPDSGRPTPDDTTATTGVCGAGIAETAMLSIAGLFVLSFLRRNGRTGV